jgi:hypothetical protein
MPRTAASRTIREALWTYPAASASSRGGPVGTKTAEADWQARSPNRRSAALVSGKSTNAATTNRRSGGDNRRKADQLRAIDARESALDQLLDESL